MQRPALSPNLESAALLCGRLLIATIFLHEAIVKMGNYAGAVKYTLAFGLPEAAPPLAIAVELGCGVLIVAGFFTRPTALVLAGFCVVTAAVFHVKFSEVNQVLHFEKNLAMAGGLIVLAIAGPGRFALEAMLPRGQESR